MRLARRGCWSLAVATCAVCRRSRASASEQRIARAAPCSLSVDSAVHSQERRCSERYLGPGMVDRARSRCAAACAVLTLRLAKLISRATAAMSRWRPRSRCSSATACASPGIALNRASASAVAYTTAGRCAAGIAASSPADPFELGRWHTGAQRPCFVRPGALAAGVGAADRDHHALAQRRVDPRAGVDREQPRADAEERDDVGAERSRSVRAGGRR